jgi:hypothetical protein
MSNRNGGRIVRPTKALAAVRQMIPHGCTCGLWIAARDCLVNLLVLPVHTPQI